jgi:hypothetical protein
LKLPRVAPVPRAPVKIRSSPEVAPLAAAVY